MRENAERRGSCWLEGCDDQRRLETGIALLLACFCLLIGALPARPAAFAEGLVSGKWQSSVAGFIVGAQYGTGALREEGKTVGYYNTVAASYGLQAGAQKFGIERYERDGKTKSPWLFLDIGPDPGFM